MDYTGLLTQYTAVPDKERIAAAVADARAKAPENYNTEVYKTCYGCIDLTSLNVTDSDASIREFSDKTVAFNDRFPGIPNVASICVFPNFVEAVGLAVGDSGIKITSVCGGFPASHTFLEVKMLETAMAVESGADEVDIVINVGQMLTGQYDEMSSDIEILRREAGEGTVFKVIIESGTLQTPELIYKASLLAMFAGADFVKTSTGKIPVAATPEAAAAICTAIRDYFENTGRMVGFKAAGGVKTPQDAALYYSLVGSLLGPEWQTPQYFRIGASSAANNLLSAITGSEVKYY